MKKIIALNIAALSLASITWAKPNQALVTAIQTQIAQMSTAMAEADKGSQPEERLTDLWVRFEIDLGIKRLVFGANVKPEIELHWTQ